MKYTFKTTFLGGELTVETDTLSDIVGVFIAGEPAKEITEPLEKDPNQMELPFEDEAPKKTRKPRAKKEEPAVIEKETNIAGVEIKEEPEVLLAVPKEEPKEYTKGDLQKAIMDFVIQDVALTEAHRIDLRAARTESAKALVLKYSRTTAAADFPVEKIGDFLKDLEALN